MSVGGLGLRQRHVILGFLPPGPAVRRRPGSGRRVDPSGGGVVNACRAASLALAVLAVACSTPGAPQGPALQGGPELRLVASRGDAVSVVVAGGATEVVVTRERGIGGATLERAGAGWPGELAVVLEGFSNLESFAACSGERCVETDLRSAPRAKLRGGRDESWATDLELPVRVAPGSIRVGVPAAAVAGGADRLELRWVDEYRG